MCLKATAVCPRLLLKWLLLVLFLSLFISFSYCPERIWFINLFLFIAILSNIWILDNVLGLYSSFLSLFLVNKNDHSHHFWLPRQRTQITPEIMLSMKRRWKAKQSKMTWKKENGRTMDCCQQLCWGSRLLASNWKAAHHWRWLNLGHSFNVCQNQQWARRWHIVIAGLVFQFWWLASSQSCASVSCF